MCVNFKKIFICGYLHLQITTDLSLRNAIFNYHLIARSGGKRYRDVKQMHPPSISFDKDGYWSDILKRQFVFARGNVTCNTYLMIETFDDPKHKQVRLFLYKKYKHLSITIFHLSIYHSAPVFLK